MLRLETLSVKSSDDWEPGLEIIETFAHLFSHVSGVLKVKLLEGVLGLVDGTLHGLEAFFDIVGVELFNGHLDPRVGKVGLDSLVDFKGLVPEILVRLNVLLDLGELREVSNLEVKVGFLGVNALLLSGKLLKAGLDRSNVSDLLLGLTTVV